MKKSMYLFLLICLISSCVSSRNNHMADKNSKYLKVDMTKKDVVSVMGDNYLVIGGKEDIIIWGYETADGVYQLSFKNGRLEKWNKLWKWQYQPNMNKTNNTSSFNSTRNRTNSGLKQHLDAHRNAMLSGATTEAEKSAINIHMDAHTNAMLGHP